MKKFIQAIPFLSLIILLGAAAASAQSSIRGKVEIPFDFSISGKTFDAGSYGIRILRTTAGSAAVTLVDNNGHALRTVVGMVRGEATLDDGQLLFDRSGDDRVLRQIAIRGSNIAIPVSRERRRLTTTVGSIERLVVPIANVN